MDLRKRVRKAIDKTDEKKISFSMFLSFMGENQSDASDDDENNTKKKLVFVSYARGEISTPFARLCVQKVCSPVKIV